MVNLSKTRAGAQYYPVVGHGQLVLEFRAERTSASHLHRLGYTPSYSLS